jgi:serine/threonine-protein phosphatase 5
VVAVFAEHKYAHAVDLYTQALEIRKDNAILYSNRAFAHIRLEEYGSAIEDASKAIELDPLYPKVGDQSMAFHKDS